MATYWPSSLLCVFIERDEVKVHKIRKKRMRPISSYLDRTSLVMSLCVFTLNLCWAVFVTKCVLATHQHLCFLCFRSHWHFWFSHFLVPSQQETHRKSLYCHRKYFAKEKVNSILKTMETDSWTSVIFFCRNKMGNPQQAVSLHFACLGSQSQRRIWFILPAHGASHTTKLIC